MQYHYHKPKSASGGEETKLRQICLRYEKEIAVSRDYMFWFLMLWTITILVLEWLDFFDVIAVVPETMAVGYTILLGAYVAHKEVSRWADIETRVRRGELFVYIWWGMFLAMFLASIFREGYYVPSNMPTLSYEVLGLFIFTEISKSINSWEKHKRHNPL